MQTTRDCDKAQSPTDAQTLTLAGWLGGWVAGCGWLGVATGSYCGKWHVASGIIAQQATPSDAPKMRRKLRKLSVHNEKLVVGYSKWVVGWLHRSLDTIYLQRFPLFFFFTLLLVSKRGEQKYCNVCSAATFTLRK